MTADQAEQRLLAGAETRHGILTAADVAEAGLSSWLAEDRVRAGRWLRLHPGVFRVAGANPSFEQTLLAAILASNVASVASHRAAARLWTIPGFRDAGPEMTRTGRQSARAGSLVHRTRCLPAGHVTSHRSIAVTTVARTLFDLAAIVHPGRVERALDAALSARLCRLNEVRDVFCTLARRGRRGSAAMRALLTERGADFVAPASELEHRARRLLASSDLPQPELEVTLGDAGGPIGRVDTFWRHAGLIVEWDGLRYHGSLSAARDDARRDERFAARGLRVRRFTWFDVTQRPAWVVSQIRDELAAASADGQRTVCAQPE